MSELHQKEKIPGKGNFLRLLAMILLVYLAVFGTIFALFLLPKQIEKLRNDIYYQISSVQSDAVSTLSETDVEELLKKYLDEEKSVVASAEVSIQTMDIKGNKARISLTCVPRYAVEDASVLRFYALNTAGEVCESDEEQYNGTTFQAKISLPMDDDYNYYVTLPDAAGKLVNQCVASWEEYDSEACNLSEQTQLDVFAYADTTISGKSAEGQIALDFNEGSPEDAEVRYQVIVDGKVQDTVSMENGGVEWTGPMSLSGEDFTQGQTVIFRVIAEDAIGRRAEVYADTGLRYDEDGYWETVMVNAETGEIE